MDYRCRNHSLLNLLPQTLHKHPVVYRPMTNISSKISLFFAIIMASSPLNTPSAAVSSSSLLAFASVPPAEINGGISSDAAAELPQLPAPDPDKEMRTIKLGESISFESMGPVIINVDGTTKSISNWDQLTEKEQEVTWRRISKRNEERRKKLLEQQERETN